MKRLSKLGCFNLYEINMSILCNNIFSRHILSKRSRLWYVSQILNKSVISQTEQAEYLKSAIVQKYNLEWNDIKNKTLCKHGTINEKNIDAVILKVTVNCKNFEAASSFVSYLKKKENSTELPLGVINGLLHFYIEYAKENNLSKEDADFILNTYTNLYDKYKVLEYFTCEKLLHALCAIDEWKKSLKIIDDITLTTLPTHSAYSTLIGTLFRNNRKAEAYKVIESSLKNRRALQHCAFEEWIRYVLRKYKDNKIIIKYLDEICVHISKNHLVIPEKTAQLLKDTYTSVGWVGRYTKIKSQSGECISCNATLDCLKLSDEEFINLQDIVKEKLIIGSDLFLKTSPAELLNFLNFVKKTAPYDVVIDALNVAYAVGKGGVKDRIIALTSVVDYFAQKNKKILLLGRRHMLRWRKDLLQTLSKKTCTFFTEDISQDDPFFITAAILSGSHTDIVSKDLLRGHRFVLKDENIKHLFQKWQWQHQWMVFVTKQKPIIQPPLIYTPCAQRNNSGWHIPYEKENISNTGLVNNGIPDCSSWLCLMPEVTR